MENLDLNSIVVQYVKENPLFNTQVRSYNDMIDKGISDIITNVFKLESFYSDIDALRAKGIKSVRVLGKFENVRINKPETIKIINNEKVRIPVFPNQCIISRDDYSGTILVDLMCDIEIDYLESQNKKSEIVTLKKAKDIEIGKFPIMVGSNRCNRTNLDDETCEKLEEETNSICGYFILKGVEWAVSATESLSFNEMRIYNNNYMALNEKTRLEFISKPGLGYENSYQTILHYISDSRLLVSIIRNNVRDCHAPFYVYFKMLGILSDKSIFEFICLCDVDRIDKQNKMNQEIYGTVKQMFEAQYSFPTSNSIVSEDQAIDTFVQNVDKKNVTSGPFSDNIFNKETTINLRKFVRENIIDTYFLPHIKDKLSKARFLGLMIRDMIKVNLGYKNETDRNDFTIKRVHTVGHTMSTVFKSIFNLCVLNQLKSILKSVVLTTLAGENPKEKLKNILHDINMSDVFSRKFTVDINLAIKSSPLNDDSNKSRIYGSINQIQLSRKNLIAIYSDLRQVICTSKNMSKASERQKKLRRNHQTSFGYLCSISTSSNEKTGLNKQLAITSDITLDSPDSMLKEDLKKDPMVINVKDMNPKHIFSEHTFNCNIFVNKELIGYTSDPINLVKKYRMKKRNLELGSLYVDVYWETYSYDVYFWTTKGRLTRPLIIMYNNKSNPEYFEHKFNGETGDIEKTNFEQKILLKQSHIDAIKQGKMTIMDLCKAKIIEFVSCIEQSMNGVLCPSLEEYYMNRKNIMAEYTHLDIPISCLGIAALTCPFGEHNNTPRTLYQTNQAKQACGMSSKFNWANRVDKSIFVYNYPERALCGTIVDNFIPLGGSNCLVALISDDYNQEDAISMNVGAIQSGLFSGSKLTYEMYTQGIKSKVRMPLESDTENADNGWNYDKLDPKTGLVRIGTYVEKGDVLIGIVEKLSGLSDSGKKYRNISKPFKENKAIVHNVIIGSDKESKNHYIVVLRIIKIPEIGDKFSMRCAQKGVIGRLIDSKNKLFTSTGETPSILINSHAIPTRMTIGQLFESIFSVIHADDGTFGDYTFFSDKNIGRTIEILKQKCTKQNKKVVDMMELICGKTEIPLLDRFKKIMHQINDPDKLKYGVQKYFSYAVLGEIETHIFSGIIFYQRLMKFVSDTIYTVEKGNINVLTRQPLGGRSSGGGLKLGEMEKDILSSQGIPSFLNEKMYSHSDLVKMYFCRTCGQKAVVNENKKDYFCNQCQEDSDIVYFNSSNVFNIISEIVKAMGISPKLNFE